MKNYAEMVRRAAAADWDKREADSLERDAYQFFVDVGAGWADWGWVLIALTFLGGFVLGWWLL